MQQKVIGGRPRSASDVNEIHFSVEIYDSVSKELFERDTHHHSPLSCVQMERNSELRASQGDLLHFLGQTIKEKTSI